MNARQMKKNLKRQINKLKSDNDLMRRIIEDSSAMNELYNLFNKPLNVRHTTMEFQEYKSKRYLPPDRPCDAGVIALFKHGLANDLFDGIKNNITYEIDDKSLCPTITASILVGKKEKEEF